MSRPEPAGAVIRSHAEHRRLNQGDLVRAANGELLRATKPRSAPEETWLERWSDEYGITLTDEGVGSYADDRLFPLTVVQVTAPGGEPLADAERKYLAMHARYESNRQDDVRYWDADPQKRLALKRRWREIADWLHPEPWGEQPQQRPAELAGVEDGRITAWNAGHVKSLKVIRDTTGEMPLVDCPECGQPASVDTSGDIRCLTVSGCFGGWRVAVTLAVGGMSNHRHFTYKTAAGYQSPFMWPTREAAEEVALQASPDGTATVFEVPQAREDPAAGSTE